ncbi:MFS transporter [Kitasatospora sp. RB6PN24]|uniref:MFS transporter n=1 Tax=Kitasatospora humi TaxID=2893891 RepID=UPI001E322FC6|nr:MFS transporter [Kitasatospora humi]MCC9305835.1 MFS transporter [Kitasatospora humi]
MRLPGRRFAAISGNPAFRRMWIGQFTSDLGSSVTVLALPMLAVAASGSAAEAGLLGTLTFLITWLTSMPAGQLADRYPPRRVLLGCDTVRLAAVAAIAAGALLHRTPFWLLALAVVVANAASMPFAPAAGKMLRTVVPADQLPEAVSVNQVRGYTASIVGPAVGGALFAAGRAVPFLTDALTYAVSLGAVRGLPAGAAPAPSERTGRPERPRLRDGLRVVRTTPFLRSTLLYSQLANPAVSMLLFVVLLRPRAGGGGVGLSLSAAAAAGLAGSTVAPWVFRRLGLRRLMLAVCLLRLLVAAVAALVGGPVALGAALATVLLLGPVVGAAITATTLQLVDYEVYGRVAGTSSFIGSALQPLAPLAAGVLVQTGGARSALGVVAALFACCALTVVLGRGLDPAAPEAAEPEGDRVGVTSPAVPDRGPAPAA